MSRKILIMDTSILCCWLRVPGKETAGSGNDKWTPDRIEKRINEEMERNSTFVLPVASLIETGNHIAQAPSRRYECATKLAEYIVATADNQSPWAAFTNQSALWETEQLKNLAKKWPDLAKQGVSIGDATIKDVAEYYAKPGWQVEILTADAGLKAYEPQHSPPRQPRRRSAN